MTALTTTTTAPAIRRPRLTFDTRPPLLVALLFSALYAVQMLIDLLRPKLIPTDPAIGFFLPFWPVLPRVVFWLVLVSWAVAILLLVGWWLTRRTRPVAPATVRLVIAGVLLAPFVVYPLATVFGHLGYALVCVPSSAFALWAVVRMQRYRRMPGWLPLALFAWGATIAAGFGAAMNTWVLEWGPSYYGGINALVTMNKVYTITFVSAGVGEELGKGAGVMLVYLLLRRHFDGVVSGIVVGAAVGLGFNFTESVEYMSAANGAAAEFQFYIRQSAGIMAAHVAFTAAIGAGFGVARQLADPLQRRLAIAAGYVGAASAHFANDTLLRWLSQHPLHWFAAGSAPDILIAQLFPLVVLQGPFVVFYLVLLHRGLRSQRAGLAAELGAEAGSGGTAVTEAEVPILLDPARRLWLRIATLRRYGPAAYRAVSRLHAAQLELGTQLWHRARAEADPHAPDDETLRGLVLRRKQEVQSTVIAGQSRRAVPA